MKTCITSFSREHLEVLQEQKDTATTGLLPNQLDLLEADPWTLTLFCGDEIVMCGGIVKMWEGRGEAWAILSSARHAHAVAVFRAAKALIEFAQNTLKRIEANVVAEHAEGCRFAEHLGFKRESFRPFYFPDGRNAIGYARLRNG